MLPSIDKECKKSDKNKGREKIQIEKIGIFIQPNPSLYGCVGGSVVSGVNYKMLSLFLLGYRGGGSNPVNN